MNVTVKLEEIGGYVIITHVLRTYSTKVQGS